jgi:hypothetical protein
MRNTRSLVSLMGVLLCAAPLFSAALDSKLPAAADPVMEKGELKWFLLTETKAEVSKQLGLPVMAAAFGADFDSWQYQIGPTEEEGYSHQLVFRKSTGTLISVARNYEPEREVDALFPDAQTTTHFYPNAAKPEFRVRVRKLSGGRLLLGIGISKAGEKTGQIFMIRREDLRYFYPWLAEQLK